MRRPLPPDNERERLAALERYAILDTPPEPGFDALTELAAHIAGTPIALVSLVDDHRQWFKSHHGLDATETPREVSFCGHVVESSDLLVVPDARADERFADNPLVTGAPHVRSYCGVPLTTANGLVLGTLCVIDHKPTQLDAAQQHMLGLIARQVVDKIQARLALQSTRQLAAVVESSDDAILTMSTSGTITSWNDAASAMFGYTADEVLGKPTNILYPADKLGEEAQLLARLKLGERLDHYETVRVHRDGREVDVSVSISPLVEPDGAIVGASKIIRDIGERKRLERLQTEFVSTVSHELRTPLTSIRGSLGLVSGGVVGKLPDEAKEYVDIALANSERLVRLINDILDMEKMESGSMEFRLESKDLRAVLRRAVSENEAYATSQKARLRIVGGVPDCEILIDVDRFLQVLANLISNAAKYSPAGADVEVSAERRGEKLRIAVRDHGPGIPDDFKDRIFERFSQADGSTTREKGGTGLGLSISKAIVERLRGHIGFEVGEGGGSVFWFELPYLPSVSADTVATTGPRLLVCEDDPDVARALEGILETEGYRVDRTPTLERARRLLETQDYAAITMDLMLADGNGVDLIREIRASDATRMVPIIVVSGSDSPLGHAAVSVSDVLQKPFDSRALLDAIDNAVTMCGATQPTLLHVEDDPDLRRILRRTLPAGWAVRSVQTVAAARRELSEHQFDLVLLDLELPDGQGDELIELVGSAQVIIFSATEAPAALSERVAAVMVKSRSDPMDVRRALQPLLRRGRVGGAA